MNVTYLTETTSVTAQNIIDSTASTFSVVRGSACVPPNASLNAYSGLVPISPYTTPSAASVSVVIVCASERCEPA